MAGADLFVPDDFAAFAGERQTSKRYNRQRQEVKAKLEHLAIRLRQSEAGPLLADFGHACSDAHPSLRNHHRVASQILYFVRPESVRTRLAPYLDQASSLAQLVDDPEPMHRHLLITFQVDAQGLKLQLELHPGARVDRRNVLARYADLAGRPALASALAALDGEYTQRCGPNDPEPIAMDAMLQCVELEPTFPVYVGRTLPSTGDPIGSVLEGLRCLIPLFRAVAWSEDNDYLGLASELEKTAHARREETARRRERETRRAQERRASQDRARRRALQEGAGTSVLGGRRREPSPADRKPRARPGDRRRSAPGGRGAPPERRTDGRRHGGDGNRGPYDERARQHRSRPQRPGGREGDERRGRGPRAGGGAEAVPLPDASAPQVPVSEGDSVAIVEGLFAGKVGTVLTTDADGDSLDVSVGSVRMTLRKSQVRRMK